MSRTSKIILLIVFPVITVLSVLVWGTDEDSRTRTSASSNSAAPAGTKALYLLLEELNLPVGRHLKSFIYLGSSNKTTLIITNPKAIKISGLEFDNLDKWIRRGNRLLLIVGYPKGARRESDDFSGPAAGNPWKLADHFHLKTGKAKASSAGTVSAEPPGFSGTIKVSPEGRSRWKKPGSEWKIIVEDRSEPILLWKKYGEGEVFALSDPGMFSNGHISREGNAKLALAILAGSGEILFDEYHHGSGSADTLWTFVGDSVFSLILLQITVAVGCFFYSRRAATAGRYRPISVDRGRSSLEYVDSMANVIESCKAGSTALEAILHRFLGKLSRGRGLRADLSNMSSKSFEIKLPGADKELTDILEQCAEAVKTGADEDRCLELTRKLNSFKLKKMVSDKRHL